MNDYPLKRLRMLDIKGENHPKKEWFRNK